MGKSKLNIEMNVTNIDEVLKKANRLVELLWEAKQIIDSLQRNKGC